MLYFKGIGRNKSSPITFLADALVGGYGGDYHTTYFPQATFTSSRKVYCHFEEHNYMEMDFTQVLIKCLEFTLTQVSDASLTDDESNYYNVG